MSAEIYFIPNIPHGTLAIMPRPRGGDWLEDDIASWKEAKFDAIVSLIEDEEREELDLLDEQHLCEDAALEFLSFPIRDRSVPVQMEEFASFVSTVGSMLRAGKSVGIHCRVGIGRSSLLAACVLASHGMPLERAWLAIGIARRTPVPDTLEQRAYASRWLTQFGPPRSS